MLGEYKSHFFSFSLSLSVLSDPVPYWGWTNQCRMGWGQDLSQMIGSERNKVKHIGIRPTSAEVADYPRHQGSSAQPRVGDDRSARSECPACPGTLTTGRRGGIRDQRGPSFQLRAFQHGRVPRLHDTERNREEISEQVL